MTTMPHLHRRRLACAAVLSAATSLVGLGMLAAQPDRTVLVGDLPVIPLPPWLQPPPPPPPPGPPPGVQLLPVPVDAPPVVQVPAPNQTQTQTQTAQFPQPEQRPL
jgi:hypothetical protein